MLSHVSLNFSSLETSASVPTETNSVVTTRAPGLALALPFSMAHSQCLSLFLASVPFVTNRDENVLLLSLREGSGLLLSTFTYYFTLLK